MTETSKIYIDIQSLLDIRQGTLYQLYEDKNKLADYLLSEEYNFRTKDIFPDVDMTEYEKVYDSGNSDILPASSLTYCINVLRSKISNMEKRNTYYGESKVPEIVLNVYPFKLEEWQVKQIQNLLFVKLQTECIISIINVSINEVSPIFIKSNGIIVAIIYSFTEWMNAHSAILENNKITDCILYFPSIGKTDQTEEDAKALTKVGFKDVFSYFEFLTCSVMNVNFLPNIFYSNFMTALAYLNKFDISLKNKNIGEEVEDVDISHIKFPEGV